MALTRETKKMMSRILHACCQRIPGLLLVGFLFVAFAGPILFPDVYWTVTISVYVFLITNAVRLAAGLAITAVKTKTHTETDWVKRYHECVKDHQVDLAVKYDDVFHLIIIPNYKEEFETLCETLDTLANHSCAKAKYKVILAMEEGEKESDEKAKKLISIFKSRFHDIRHTIHPSNLPGEARGKSSNVAWAAVYYSKNWMNEDTIRNEIFTVMDADTQLTEKYFECMTYKYCTSTADEQSRTMFGPVLIFDRNSQLVPFPVRVADICWSIGLMANFQIPIRFPCSCYSVSHLLARSVNFWDAGPEAIGEDFHMAMKCWTATHMNLKFTPVYIPASCSNVQADTYWSSCVARFQQSKRHLWGLLDFGYAVARTITQRNWYRAPLMSTLCLYILFEIFYQAFFGFYHLTGSVLFPSSVTPYGAIVLQITYYIRISLVPSAIIVAIGYERYHHVCCQYRARILAENRQYKITEAAILAQENGEEVPVIEEYVESRVAFRQWYSPIDWAALPICLIFFYLIPAVNAMFMQMFTNKLDYKVSLKPTTRAAVPHGEAAPIEEDGSALFELQDSSDLLEETDALTGQKETMSVSIDSAAQSFMSAPEVNSLIENEGTKKLIAKDSGLSLDDGRDNIVLAVQS